MSVRLSGTVAVTPRPADHPTTESDHTRMSWMRRARGTLNTRVILVTLVFLRAFWDSSARNIQFRVSARVRRPGSR
jgi:hypothetical protein